MREPEEFHEFEGTGSVGTKGQFLAFMLIIAAIGAALWFLLKNYKQTLAGTVFLALVIGTLMFWRLRVGIAFIGIAFLLLTRTINLSSTIEYMSLDVIVFLVGMMVIVGLLRRSGFFRHVVAAGLKATNFRPNLLFAAVLTLSAVMAAMVDEVTSIFFVTALVLDLCDYFEVKPVNYVIFTVLATNIGSSWTVLGNPVGILIALRSKLTLEDFLGVAFPIGLAAFVFLIIVALLWQRRDLRQLRDGIKSRSIEEQRRFLDDWAGPRSRRLFWGSVLLFASVLASIALHHRMELLLCLEHNTLLVVTSIGGAGAVLVWQRKDAREFLTKDVDWATLVFFMFLFAKAGAIKYVGLTDVIAHSLANFTSGTGGLVLLIVIVVWLSGITSAVMDNVVVVAAFLPVIEELTKTTGSPVLYWALLTGACFGGNLTMVGSTANIVSLGILEARKNYNMTFGYWLKIGLLGSLVPLAIATVVLIVMYT
ncbi:MAG: SLC13 family permease [Planctomycetota bacterium]|nr:SLC13 family permease [Planctomycetota bacterium]